MKHLTTQLLKEIVENPKSFHITVDRAKTELLNRMHDGKLDEKPVEISCCREEDESEIMSWHAYNERTSDQIAEDDKVHQEFLIRFNS